MKRLAQIPFGVYKGRCWTDVPADYLQWVVDNVESSSHNDSAKRALRKLPRNQPMDRRRMQIAGLRSLMNPNGLSLRKCAENHWKVEGGVVVVNVWIGPKGVTIYIEGTAGGCHVRKWSDVITAATTVPNGRYVRAKAKRHRSNRPYRERLHRGAIARGETPACHWCGREFESVNDSTLDHVIPLAKGGSNGQDNVVLACPECNANRADNVTKEDLLK